MIFFPFLQDPSSQRRRNRQKCIISSHASSVSVLHGIEIVAQFKIIAKKQVLEDTRHEFKE